jgi:hypothetical protein
MTVTQPESRSLARRALGTASATGSLFLGLSPWDRAPRPRSCADITAEWLTATIAPTDSLARIEGFERTGGTSGTTDRNLLALRWNAAGSGAGLPESIFVKTTPLPPQNRAMLAVLQMAKGEVEFYRSARPSLDGVAPHAYYTEYSLGGRQMLLLEDLVAAGGSMFALADECPLDHARSLVEELAHLHGTFWETPRFATDMAWAHTQTRRPGFTLMQVMFKYCRRHIIKNADQLGCSVKVVELAGLLNKHTTALAPLWEQMPTTLCHGDTHLGNTYRQADGRAGLLDWQVVHRAHGLRDIAYFLVTSVSPDMRRDNERELIARYLTALAAHGVDVPTENAAWELYRLFALDGWDAAMSTIAFGGLQDRANSERSLHNANAAAEDLDLTSLVKDAIAGRWRVPA